MDRWSELFALGIDALIFGICSRLYEKYVYSVNALESAYRLGINPDYKKLTPDEREYVVYRGDVKALGAPLTGFQTQNVPGVILRLIIREYAIARNASGFWAGQKKVIQDMFHVVPFMLKCNNTSIHIMDPLEAEILDLDMIYHKFENSSLGFMDYIIGFFNGMHQRGIETTEELLKEGTVITAIGEISCDLEGNLQLSPPTKGFPYYLTTMTVSSLIRKLEEHKTTYRRLSFFFGGIGLVLAVIIARRWWLDRKIKLKDQEIKKKLEISRKERRQKARKCENLTDAERCVVCSENPKEIIILPCGHVCVCEDCSENIRYFCPVCRTPIDNKAAAYIT